MPIMSNETYYSLREVAEKLGISLGSVRNYVTQGRIKTLRFDEIRGSVLVSKADFDEFASKPRKRGNPLLQKK